MTIDTATFAAPPDSFRTTIHSKSQICLHFTAGYNARGCAAAFTRSGAGTAFILDTNGMTYQWFDPRYWDCHIYRHKTGEDKRFYELEKATIGIEIANVGPLSLGKAEKTKTTLYTYTGKPYCDLSEVSKYVQGEYRGKFYWAAFTEGQYAALRTLLPELAAAFGINLLADPLGARTDFWPIDKLINYNGITNHGNYRRDKYDIGPAFDWSLVGLS